MNERVEWIEVEERLPEDGTRIIFMTKDGEKTDGWYYENDNAPFTDGYNSWTEEEICAWAEY